MAKLCILISVILISVQISLAARLRRDVENPEDQGLDASNIFNDLIKHTQSVFNQENFEKLGANLQELGEQVKSKASELSSAISESIKSVSKKEE